ncbi:MAG TPA: maleylpyruvate isomerase N-terminal domain-containing protein, partial [Nocardioides sp.]|nr:maleylpyruvate isomerase N-terminal domain-containing protein [Nocardioides sp.]
MTDWGELYREHVTAVSALGADLTEGQLATVVPATPAWTVHDVLAHMAGCGSDAVTGRMDGAPAPEWTARHVNERAQLPVADLVEELHTHQDAVADSVADNPRPALVWNIAVHHADLHEALGLARMPERLWLPIADAVS